MEQKTIFWAEESLSCIGSQIKEQLEEHCVDGWYVHQIQPTNWIRNSQGDLILEAAIIILNKNK